jgi:quinol monooxygenase YgiN
MVILRFKIRSKPDKSDELMSALAEIITPARATNGVINFDIARDLLDPDSFIATAIYDDGAALELQESLPEVDRVMTMLPASLVAPPERTIFDASPQPDAGLNLLMEKLPRTLYPEIEREFLATVGAGM